jgi:hypothetical protein
LLKILYAEYEDDDDELPKFKKIATIIATEIITASNFVATTPATSDPWRIK